MGPLDILAYTVLSNDSSEGAAVVTAMCIDCGCKFDNPHEVQAAMFKGIRRRGMKIVELPEAGHA
jgi:hypothetical protein